jgi:hypothetical protein
MDLKQLWGKEHYVVVVSFAGVHGQPFWRVRLAYPCFSLACSEV